MARKAASGDPSCKVKGCGRAYSEHSGKKCMACFAPIEHHDKESEAECWEGRARMARAIKEAGPVELRYKDENGDTKIVMTAVMNDTDHEALRRCPHPSTLTAFDGYQVLEDS